MVSIHGEKLTLSCNPKTQCTAVVAISAAVLHAFITGHNENAMHTTRYASCVFRAACSLCVVLNTCSTDGCLLGVQIRLYVLQKEIGR